MLISQKLLGLGLGIVLALLNLDSAIAQNNAAIVAQVGGVKLTMADLEREESAKLLQAGYQYYQVESKALDDLIGKQLLEQKAKSENLTVDQLVDRDIKSQVKDPTEDQLKVYYEGLETEQPYDVVRGKILDKIRQLRTDKIRTAYVKALREQVSVIVELAPPSANVSVESGNTFGSRDAPVMLIEFADYECPYCQKVAPDITKLESEFGSKLAVTYKDFPLPMHAHAEKAAEAARCAGKQGKFWEYHDELFRSKELDVERLKEHALNLGLDWAQFGKCLDEGDEAASVQQDRAEGTRLGLSGTPSFFINGHFFSGALDYVALRQIINQQLAAPPRQVAMVPPR